MHTLVSPVNTEDLKTFFKNKSFTVEEQEVTDPSEDLPLLVSQLIDCDDIKIRPEAGKVKVRKIAKDAGVSHERGGIYWIMDILFEVKLQFTPPEQD